MKSPYPGKKKAISKQARGHTLSSQFSVWEPGCKGHNLHSSLTEIINRARTAVQTRAETSPSAVSPLLGIPAKLSAPPPSPPPADPLVGLTPWQKRTKIANQARAAALPLSGFKVDARLLEPPPPRVLANYPEARVVLAKRRLGKGELRLWLFLHRLAVDKGRECRYEHTPHQISVHCPAVSIAGALRISDRHLRRLAAGLERAGLIDCGGHAQQVGLRSLYDGTLWAVLMVPSEQPPRLTADEWKHNWRPDFEADVLGKTGAAAEMSELRSIDANTERLYTAVKHRAAAQSVNNAPLASSPDIFCPASLKRVIEGLSGLWKLHSSKRPRAVGKLASEISAALIEPGRRRYWCKVIWEALNNQDAGRTSDLGALIGQFDRLGADLREGAPWRSPGAILAARWKGANV